MPVIKETTKEIQIFFDGKLINIEYSNVPIYDVVEDYKKVIVENKDVIIDIYNNEERVGIIHNGAVEFDRYNEFYQDRIDTQGTRTA